MTISLLFRPTLQDHGGAEDENGVQRCCEMVSLVMIISFLKQRRVVWELTTSRREKQKVSRTHKAKHGRKHKIKEAVGIVTKWPHTRRLLQRRICTRTGRVVHEGLAIVVAAAAELIIDLKPSVYRKGKRCSYLLL